MINFILCDDNLEILQNMNKIVTKVMMPLDYEYQVHKFSDYNKKMDSLIKNDHRTKIYLLDIELPTLSGLEIASKIRENDWDSFIIILTVHGEFTDEVFRTRLMIVDYISKCNQYEKRLSDTLNTAIKAIGERKVITFKTKGITYRVNHDEILYVEKCMLDKKCMIATSTNKLYANMPLKEIKEKLGKEFFQCHKSYLVNINKIRGIDLDDDTIIFNNNLDVRILSKRLGRKLNDYLKDIK